MKTLIYLAQVSACTGIFFLFYKLVLSRFTFFTLNRFYLLATLMISFSIPLISIPASSPQPLQVFKPSVLPEQVFIPSGQTETTAIQATEEPFNWQSLATKIYLLAVFALAFHLLSSILLLYLRLRNKEATSLGNIKVIKDDKKYKNGSFLNYIFLDAEELTTAELEQVLTHELAHICLLHSVDKIFARLLQVILWFNPFSYLYIKAVAENHEFEVDRYVTLGKDKNAYAELLLKLSVSPESSLYHHFSMIPLRRRIQMLFIKPTKNMKKVMYGLVMPLVLITCLAFANRATSIDENESEGKSLAKITKLPNDTLKSDNNQYRQKVKYDQDKQAERWRAVQNSDQYKKNVMLAKKLPQVPFEATVTSLAGVSADKEMGGKSSRVIVAVQGDQYFLGTFEPATFLADLKVGDKLKIKMFHSMYSGTTEMVSIFPDIVEKEGEVIYKRKALKIEPTAFLFEANRARLSDCTIEKVSKLAGGKIGMRMSINGFTLNVQFDATQTKLSNLSIFKPGDEIRLRFVHEVKTGPKSYLIRDWVCISPVRREREYGVKNDKLFFKFYEKAPALADINN